jgi:hypothetical protein
MMIFEHTLGSELPDDAFEWTDAQGAVIDFSTGWTFSVEVGFVDQDAVLTKDEGISGAATSPNVTISWAEGELDDPLTAGGWPGWITAVNTASGKERKRSFLLKLNSSTS